MGTLKILIVDDEEIVARAMTRMLCGHRVEVETDARVAVARLLDGEEFDVIICDLKMPQLDGLEVLRVSRGSRESAIFILVSGMESDLLQHADGALLKPFTRDALLTLIARLVDERTNAPTKPMRSVG
jgi:CheY-like chemotaxis protein